MRINKIDVQSVQNKYSVIHKQENSAEFSINESDNVALSDSAIAFANAVKQVKTSFIETSSEDLIKLRRISKQIKEGTYHVETDAIVDKMLNGM